VTAERFLADTSVFAWLSNPPVAAAFARLAVGGHVALCSPVAFELGYAARSRDDHANLVARLGAFALVPTTDGDHRRSLAVQAVLASRGQHRALSLVDALVAAIAEARGLVVLHYDADFELISAVTGQPHQWIVDRGTVD
jgi:predicted nucleic acid-binding protein